MRNGMAAPLAWEACCVVVPRSIHARTSHRPRLPTCLLLLRDALGGFSLFCARKIRFCLSTEEAPVWSTLTTTRMVLARHLFDLSPEVSPYGPLRLEVDSALSALQDPAGLDLVDSFLRPRDAMGNTGYTWSAVRWSRRMDTRNIRADGLCDVHCRPQAC